MFIRIFALNKPPENTTMTIYKEYGYDIQDGKAIIPEWETEIKEKAFWCCKKLTSVEFPLWIKKIGNSAFWDCSSLTEITLPEWVEEIGEYAFWGCENLKSIILPRWVKKIGDYAFYGCSSLTSITIPPSVTEIGDCAFSDCSSLTSITIPPSVTKIKGSLYGGTFRGCSSLTSITIPPSVTEIEGGAFSHCNSLSSVHISDIAAWCKIVFGKENFNPLSLAHRLYINGEEIRDLVIPDSVTKIGYSAFRGCSNLTSISIPPSVTEIGGGAFSGCKGLTSVHINDIAAWCNIDFAGIDSNPLYYAHHLYLNGEEVKDLVIPNSVTSIGDYAFCECYGLASVTIGSGVTSIGNGAFRSCYGLQDVYCYAENVPSTESDAFYPEYATLHVPAASIESYKTTEPWSGFGNIVALTKEYQLTISSVGYATLYLDFNAEIPEGVEAYVATEVVDSRLKMQKVDGVLPANTGVIIVADQGTYTFTESDETPATIEKNLLQGSVTNTYVTAEANTTYYVLSAPDGDVAMYRALITDGKFLNNAHKAYLPISNGDLGIFDDEVDSSVEQLSRRLVFDFGDETGIDEVKTENGNVKTDMYDLAGRRVKKAQKGVYIVNGELKVVK